MILTFNISGNYLIRYLFNFFQCVWKHKNCFELTYSNISNLNGFIAVYQYLIVHWGKKMKTPLDEDLIPILSKYLYSQISVKLLISSYIMCVCLFDGVLRHFQQYFSYIVLVIFIGGKTGGPGENHRPVASHWQTWSHNVVHFALIKIRTDNISGDEHWLHR